MPVVRYGDEQNIDIFARQHIAVIVVGSAALVLPGAFGQRVIPFDDGARRLTAANHAIPIARRFTIDVAHRDNLDALVLEESHQAAGSLIAAADHSHRDLVARADTALRKGGAGGQSRGGLQKGSSIHGCALLNLTSSRFSRILSTFGPRGEYIHIEPHARTGAVDDRRPRGPGPGRVYPP